MKRIKAEQLICCQVILLLIITKVDSILFDKDYKNQRVKLQTTILLYANNDTFKNHPYPKKWQWKLGKIQKRQFGLLNTIWRKVTINDITTTATVKKHKSNAHNLSEVNFIPYVYQHNTLPLHSIPVVTTTKSLIEFNYFDSNYDFIKLKPSDMRTTFIRYQTKTNRKCEMKSEKKTMPPSLKLPRSIERFNAFRLLTPIKSDDEIMQQNVINISVDNSQGLLKASGHLHKYNFNYQISIRPLKSSNRAKNKYYVTDYASITSNAITDSMVKVFVNAEYTNKTTEMKNEEEYEQNKLEDTRKKEETNTYKQSKIKNDATQNSSSIFDVWDHFSFIAVYVYEPAHVYCDAAIISEHWLVTAGSCLYRHHKVPFDVVSAYVTYCDKNWREAEQINYVKYSVVHPHYHPTNVTRKCLYNIGLIQVANAMSESCRSLSMVSLISRHFTTDIRGSPACAVGWGLDKYNDKTINLAPSYLGIYNGIIYSNECPGNLEYLKFTSLLREGSTRPVICLSLPPYKGEQVDPIHGSILLVDQMLIGLYLQEERRPSGPQSALYTSIWGLSPWVMNVAQENEEN